MENFKPVPTTEKIVSENYPYGFKLKTTKTDFVEFSKKKGYRHCSQTIDPRSGRVNAPKKGVYYPFLVLGLDDKGHVVSFVSDFNSLESGQKVIDFFSNPNNFALFTAAQIQWVYQRLTLCVKISGHASVVYTGVDPEKAFAIIRDQLAVILDGEKSKGEKNIFPSLNLKDIAATLDGEKIDGYQPFKIISR
jgi:hypothetical protein